MGASSFGNRSGPCAPAGVISISVVPFAVRWQLTLDLVCGGTGAR